MPVSPLREIARALGLPETASARAVVGAAAALRADTDAVRDILDRAGERHPGLPGAGTTLAARVAGLALALDLAHGGLDTQARTIEALRRGPA